MFRPHTIAWGPAVQGGPRGTRFLPIGIETRHFFGPVRNWVNTGLPISLRTNNTVIDTCVVLSPFFCVKGIVHFEIKMWYLSAYPKGIQDVGVFFSSVDPILMFLGETVLVCQSYNGRYRSLSL